MLLHTRQFAGSARRPPSAQPFTYIGQCVATQTGGRKLAEIGSQPRAAAAATPFECGTTTVTTMGGCGSWYGLTITPIPVSGSRVRSVEMFQNLPLRLYGGSPAHRARM